jgi:xylan 1,4-beta-xylosidase
VRTLLAKYPSLHPETFLNEWNMALRDPPTDPQFQPCLITEVAYQMKAGGLDYSCCYHIKDYHVDLSYYALKMLSRLTGERLRLDSTDPAVHGFAT